VLIADQTLIRTGFRVLTLSEPTVKTHVARIFAELGLRDRAQAVVIAFETGLVRPGECRS
jgi:hypothetical protein